MKKYGLGKIVAEGLKHHAQVSRRRGNKVVNMMTYDDTKTGIRNHKNRSGKYKLISLALLAETKLRFQQRQPNRVGDRPSLRYCANVDEIMCRSSDNEKKRSNSPL